MTWVDVLHAVPWPLAFLFAAIIFVMWSADAE